MNTTPLLNDPRSDEVIMCAALALSCEENSEEYWTHIRVLQHRMDANLLLKLGDLLLQGEAKQRGLVADVLAQSRVEKKQMVNECVGLLIGNLKTEPAPHVLESFCHALGHLKSPEAIASLLKLQNHFDARVRLAVVHGISCHDDPTAISALITLSADSDRDVRNWATFGLGSLTGVDSAPLRGALLARLNEDDEEIKGEALVGLALRGDPRVVDPLLKEMNSISARRGDYFSPLIIEAADAILAASAAHPDTAWSPILIRSRELGLGKPSKSASQKS